jgi:SHS2 domain-containing protein
MALSMKNEKRFKFLEHTADVYIEAYGKNLAEAFENAAFAMFDVMTEVEKITPETEENVTVSARDEYALLYNWLEALLVKFEINNRLYSKFKVALKKTPDDYKLEANIFGEKYDPKKHPQKVAVKAVTYHRMKIVKEHGKVVVRFILDI